MGTRCLTINSEHSPPLTHPESSMARVSAHTSKAANLGILLTNSFLPLSPPSVLTTFSYLLSSIHPSPSFFSFVTSNRYNFCNGLFKVSGLPLQITRKVAPLTIPSLPVIKLSTLPIFHMLRFTLSSAIITISPSWIMAVSLPAELCVSLKSQRYSFRHLFQK